MDEEKEKGHSPPELRTVRRSAQKLSTACIRSHDIVACTSTSSSTSTTIKIIYDNERQTRLRIIARLSYSPAI